jgi:stalled ribosome rescue protein Dom34
MSASVSVVWVDFENAKLFHFSEERMERETLKSARVRRHTHRPEGDEKRDRQLYEAISQKLRGRPRVLIVGAELAKTHFLAFLNEMHPDIARKVVGCETMDHLTDHQIAAFALRYVS